MNNPLQLLVDGSYYCLLRESAALNINKKRKIIKFGICQDLWSKCGPFAVISYVMFVSATKKSAVFRT